MTNFDSVRNKESSTFTIERKYCQVYGEHYTVTFTYTKTKGFFRWKKEVKVTRELQEHEWDSGGGCWGTMRFKSQDEAERTIFALCKPESSEVVARRSYEEYERFRRGDIKS